MQIFLKNRVIKDLSSIFGFPNASMKNMDKISTMGQIPGFIKIITYPPAVAAWYGEENMSCRSMHLTCVGHFPNLDTVTRKWGLDDSQVQIIDAYLRMFKHMHHYHYLPGSRHPPKSPPTLRLDDSHDSMYV